MKTRRLGKTNLDVSVVGVGTWQFGGEWGKQFSQKEADVILGRARELGINLVDTAECYGDHLSERLVGEAIKQQRDHWVVATKFGHRFHGHLQRDDVFDVVGVQQELEDSLRALQLETIDVYQFHSGPNAAFDNDDLWTMLQKQVDAGKVRFLGISISSGIDQAYQTKRASDVGASVLQVVYNGLDRDPEHSVFPYAMDQDLGILARVPLASGFLTGKYKPGYQFTDPSDVRSVRTQEKTQERLEQAQQFIGSEVPEGESAAQWALAWCLGHEVVTCVIPGCKSVAQVEENAAAAELLGADQLSA